MTTARTSFPRSSLLKKAPSWVFRLEDPNQPPPTISTLLQVAEAFDVDLEISFRSFSSVLDLVERMTPESFEVPSFDEELDGGALDQGMSTNGKLFLVPPPKAVANVEKKPPAGAAGEILRGEREATGGAYEGFVSNVGQSHSAIRYR
jgi:hypothetical protein